MNPEIEAHPLRFHGREGQYFRIWIVNVLLTLLTFGLYTPWARRRTATFFYQNTEMAGGDFEFTAPLRRMVTGFLLFGALYFAWSLASNSDNETTQLVGNVVFALALLTAPALWSAAMRFRLGHTRWRGLRLHFAPGGWALYVASWPLLALPLLGLAAALSLGRFRDYGVGGTFALMAALALLMVLCLGVLQYNLTRLLVVHTRVGAQGGRWKVERGPFLRIVLLSAGLAALLVAALWGCVALSAGLSWLPRMGPSAVLLGVALAAASWLLGVVPALAWREAQLFALVWNHTGVAQVARFRCTLSVGGFVALRMQNALLTWLTLGLYRPFARVKVFRMKAESVTLYLRGSVDVLVGALARQQEEGGFADALADGLGLDLVGA